MLKDSKLHVHLDIRCSQKFGKKKETFCDFCKKKPKIILCIVILDHKKISFFTTLVLFCQNFMCEYRIFRFSKKK
jgi:hypothetical protein